MAGITGTARPARKPEFSRSRQPADQGTAFRVSIRNKRADTVPLLMLNGVGAEYGLFNELRRNIDRTTIAFDVQREHLGRRPSIRTYATFVREVLERHRLDQVDVLGFSWGGMVAQQLAHDHSERVDRLVLASTSPGLLSVPARPSSALALMRSGRSAKDMPRLCKHLYAGDFVGDPSLVDRLGLARPSDPRTYRRQMWAALTGWSSVPWLHSIKQETMILHGDDDPAIPFVNAKLMERLMPNATLRQVSAGGHLYLYTRPQVHGRVITDFLASSQESVKEQTGFAGLLARACV